MISNTIMAFLISVCGPFSAPGWSEPGNAQKAFVIYIAKCEQQSVLECDFDRNDAVNIDYHSFTLKCETKEPAE